VKGEGNEVGQAVKLKERWQARLRTGSSNEKAVSGKDSRKYSGSKERVDTFQR